MDGKIESIIYKVLDERATTMERAALASWISISVENEAEFESFKILWESQGSDEREPDFDVGKKRLMEAIHSLEIRKRKTIRIRTAISIALFLISVVISVWNIFHEVTGASTSMRFENAPITTVEEFLTKNWDVKFSFEDNRLRDCRFNGYLINSHGDEETLKSVLSAMNLGYKIEPSGDFLISGNCGN